MHLLQPERISRQIGNQLAQQLAIDGDGLRIIANVIGKIEAGVQADADATITCCHQRTHIRGGRPIGNDEIEGHDKNFNRQGAKNAKEKQ